MTPDPAHWQLEGSAPELYERYIVPAMASWWADNLVDRLALGPGESVLDVACGTGVVARAAAGHVGQSGRVTALDLNSGMLRIGKALPPPPGAAISWLEGSAFSLPFIDETFDAAGCQFGLQFFADRAGALREVRRALKPRGRTALSVFGPIEHNPAAEALSDALDRRIGPGASLAKRQEHALADEEQLLRLMAEAGFGDVTLETTTRCARYPAVADYVRIQLLATPLSALTSGQDPSDRERLISTLIADVEDARASYVGEDGFTVPQEIHTVVATNP
jgi:ubiquinone/menaquinone biosynthesis C-methylase UbiE